MTDEPNTDDMTEEQDVDPCPLCGGDHDDTERIRHEGLERVKNATAAALVTVEVTDDGDLDEGTATFMATEGLTEAEAVAAVSVLEDGIDMLAEKHGADGTHAGGPAVAMSAEDLPPPLRAMLGGGGEEAEADEAPNRGLY